MARGFRQTDYASLVHYMSAILNFKMAAYMIIIYDDLKTIHSH